MKILWEPFSFLSILFVRLNNSTRPKTHYRHYVNAFAVFTLLFAQQCFAHDSATDKLDDNVNVTQAKWMNDNRSQAIPAALDAKALIFKRQSPTKLSNASSSSTPPPPPRMSTQRNHGITTANNVPSHIDFHHNTPTSAPFHVERISTSPPPPPPSPQPLSSLSSSHPSHMNLVTTTPASNVLILIQTKKNIELNLVRDQFQQFTDTVGVKLENITIDFDVIDGISTLIKRLDALNYSTIFYIFDESNGRDFDGDCDLAERLSSVYRRRIIFWPCPQMKKSERYLPSFQTISYAIKSISQKFNWTEAIIFADKEWGLPLAIAANLHLPYRIKIGLDGLIENHNVDAFDRLLIVTSPLNSYETLKLLTQLSGYHRSKVLIIDTIGNIFNSQHEFYQKINHHNDEWLPSNLLVLTMLTTKLKRFLNATYSTEFQNIYGGMDDELIQPSHRSEIESNITSTNESFIINLLMKRIIGIDHVDNADDSYDMLVHFNETELNLIAKVFEKLWFNGSCERVSAAAEAAEQTTKIDTKSMSNTASAQNVYNQSNKIGKFVNASSRAQSVNESISTCAPNNNSLSKCEQFLRERASTFHTNSTRTLEITKVLCKQIQLWWLRRQKTPVQPQSNQRVAQQQPSPPSHHSANNNVPKISNRKANSRLEENHTTIVANADKLDRNTNDTNSKHSSAAAAVANTSDEFVNLIPSQVDATFGEYFPFLDFIVAKLALSHNLTVNYNNQSGVGGAQCSTSLRNR